MKKVLVYDAYAKESFGGGSSRSLYLLLKNRKDSNIEYYFLTNKVNTQYYNNEIKKLGIKEFNISFPEELLIYGGKYAKGLIKQALLFLFILLPFNVRLCKRLKNQRFDLLVCNEGRATLTIGIAAKFCKLPIITFIRGDYGIGSKFNKFVSRISDKLICVSEGIYGLLSDWQKRKAKVIHNGIEMMEFENKKNNNDGIVRIVNIANISPYKGSIDLLKAIRLLVRSNKKIKLYFIGDISDRLYYEKLQEFIVINEIQDYVEFVGKTDNVHSYLEYMDIYVQPSYNEGLPRAILEAYLHKLPVIASDIPGNKSIVIDNLNGMLFRKQDYVQLAKKINILIESPELRRKYGEIGKLILLKDHNIEKSVKQFEEIVVKM